MEPDVQVRILVAGGGNTSEECFFVLLDVLESTNRNPHHIIHVKQAVFRCKIHDSFQVFSKGYEITRVLEEDSGGKLKLTFAALYPVLHTLEAEGLVRTQAENVNNRIRKYYALTPSGLKKAEALMSEFNEYLDLMKVLTSKE